MADGGKVVITMETNSAKVKRDIKNVDSSIKKMAKNSNKNVNDMKKGFGGLGKSILSGLVNPVVLAIGALASLYKITKKAVSSAIDLERSEMRLETILRTVSNATDEQINAIKRLSEEYENLLGIGSDTTNALASQLASFGLNADGIEQLMLPALDAMVAQYNTLDVSQEQAIQTANLLGKALTGQVGALSRVGILMNDQQKELIANGDEATRLATIIDVLNMNYGGLATAMGETTEGSIARMKQSLDDLFELMGGELLPVIADMAGELRDAFQSEGAKEFMIQLASMVKSLFSVIKSVWELGKILRDVFDISFNGFQMIVSMLEQVAIVLHIVTSLFKGDWAEAFLWTKKGFANLLEFIGYIVTGLVRMFLLVPRALNDAFSWVIDTFEDTIIIAMENILGIFNWVLKSFSGIINGIIDGIQFIGKGFAMLVEVVTLAWRQIFTGLELLVTHFDTIIVNVIDTIVAVLNGALSRISWFVNGAIDLLNELIKVANEIPGLDIDQIGKVDLTVDIEGEEIVTGFVDNINAMNEALDNIPDVITGLTDSIPDLDLSIDTTGEDAVNSIINALDTAGEMIDEFPDIMTDFIDDLALEIFTEDDQDALNALTGAIENNTTAQEWNALLTEENTDSVVENTDMTEKELRKQEDFLSALFNEIRAGIFDSAGGINQNIARSVLSGDFSLASVNVGTSLSIVVESTINLDGTVVAEAVSTEERNSGGYR